MRLGNKYTKNNKYGQVKKSLYFFKNIEFQLMKITRYQVKSLNGNKYWKKKQQKMKS